MVQIFVSYRREDARGSAGRLSDRLVEKFGHDSVFRDIDSIRPGENFVAKIEEHVAGCDVLLAVIGRQWLTGQDDRGRRRLDDPRDFVRLEIEAALRRDVGVIPVLVDGAEMPEAEELPSELQPLAQRNAVPLDDARWDYDVARLMAALEPRAAAAHAPRVGVRIPRRWGVVFVLVVGLVAAASSLRVPWPLSPEPARTATATARSEGAVTPAAGSASATPVATRPPVAATAPAVATRPPVAATARSTIQTAGSPDDVVVRYYLLLSSRQPQAFESALAMNSESRRRAILARWGRVENWRNGVASPELVGLSFRVTTVQQGPGGRASVVGQEEWIYRDASKTERPSKTISLVREGDAWRIDDIR